ncbi:MAG: hypothetical protein HN704_05160 [Bacteroidetes bacterium]|jgi:hypothetical protein|nr:hypothetical protein [Bacteroidota bacterium]MBT7144059.1 hypothetical protein [Bacteroidota bacterium]MBT7490981.1 hypothetical protein [Bacteroidota bacterium]
MRNYSQFINENKESFDSFEPDEGHFRRFMNRISIENPREIKFPINEFVKIAAIFIFIFGVSLIFITNIKENADNLSEIQEICLSDISDYYEEIEVFYCSKIEQKLKVLTKISYFDSKIKNEFLSKEFQEIETSYSELQKELGANGDDSRIIEAMIRNYQIKTELLDKIINELNNINPKIL